MNENSLKKLNGYLEHLHKFGEHSVQPVKLTFYVRNTKDRSDVQPVQPEIHSSGTFFKILFIMSEFHLRI